METTAGPEVGSRPAGFPAVVARALGILPPRLRRRWWALLPLLFLQAVVEWAAAAAIYVFLAGSRPAISRAWLPAGVSPVVVLAILLLVKNALVVAAIRLETGLVADSTRATFRRLLSGYLAAPLSGRDAAHSAELAHTATDALDDAFRRVLTAAASLASEAAVVAALVAAVLVRAPAAGLVAVAALAAALVTALRTTERAVAGSSRRRDELQAALRRDLGDVLAGAAELRSLGREEPAADAVVARHARFASAQRTLAAAGAVSRPAVELVFAAGLLVAALLYPASAHRAFVPLLGLVAYALFRIVPAANRAVFFVNEVRAGAPAVERIRAALARYPEPAERRKAGGAPAPFRDRLVLDAVTVRPDSARRAALDAVSLEIRRGDFLAVVGSTGAGKSTLLLVLAGLRAPDGGRVLFDGAPLSAGRGRIGWVPQNPFFADDSLRRNVALGLPDAGIDDRRVAEAIEAARLGDFVRSLPRGIDARVGEGGSLLSGGERQRLAVARALYADPEILLLDEPTSALDLATERDLMATLAALAPERTVVVVSHRPAAVERAARIVTLENGRLSSEPGQRGAAAG